MVGLSILLVLIALVHPNWKAARVTYYKWELRSAEQALAAKDGLGHFVSTVVGAGDARARYSRARQALLEAHYLSELEVPFPAGSNWQGLLSQVRRRFPDGEWELSLDPSSSLIHLTAPTDQIEAWKRCISESAVR